MSDQAMEDRAIESIRQAERSASARAFAGESFEDLIMYLVHDLEGPLAAMQTLLRLLDQGRFDPEKDLHEHLLKSTHAAMNRVRLIVSDMLKVSQLEESSQGVSWEEFPVTEVVDECIDLVRIAAHEQCVRVEKEMGEQSPTVRADRRLFARVLDNLLLNAIRHSDIGGTVRLTVTDRPDRVVISVTNGGQGFGDIDPSELFEKFKQIQHRKNTGHRGAGLGLYFCKLAVTAMHGDIKAYQTEAGETCLSVSLVRGGKET